MVRRLVLEHQCGMEPYGAGTSKDLGARVRNLARVRDLPVINVRGRCWGTRPWAIVFSGQGHRTPELNIERGSGHTVRSRPWKAPEYCNTSTRLYWLTGSDRMRTSRTNSANTIGATQRVPPCRARADSDELPPALRAWMRRLA